jgi:uncharacterized caspase-like protein
MATANANPKKLALFIGNNAYKPGTVLKCCTNDAKDLSNKFHSMGYTTTVETDADFFKMRKTIDDFADGISRNDLVVIFFAGHGVQWNDQNYLIPIDNDRIKLKIHLKDRAINVQSTLDLISAMDPCATVFLLDCCREYWVRNEALRGAETRGCSLPKTGLATMSAPAGSLVAFACKPGETTEDVSSNGCNGLFTFHLLKHVAKPNASIEEILCYVCNGVLTDTDGAQIPHRVSSFRYPNISFNSVYVQSGKHIHFNHISATLRERPWNHF